MSREKQVLIIKVVVLLMIAVLSGTVVASRASSVKHHTKSISELDEKKDNVLKLAAGATASSAAITLIPGDAGTPIADKLADLSKYFLLILCAIYFEKYLLTLTGLFSFRILIPAACLLLIITLLWQKENYTVISRSKVRRFAAKLAAFGLIIYLLVPMSIVLSGAIEHSYQDSISETIESAQKNTEELEKSSSSEDESAWKRFISKFENGVSGLIDQFESTLSSMLEAIAVLIVTSCLIPILVLIFLVWIAKMLFGPDWAIMESLKRRS
jgi:predicted PurR-regulated permease PerM